LKAERTIPHYPEQCAACIGQDLASDLKPYLGYYQFELLLGEGGFKIECQLHHYYGATCSCAHHSLKQLGKGDISEVSTRKTQLQLQEHVLVGAMLTSFIAGLAVRYRFPRAKIQEFLMDWYSVELSIGTIDRSIREAGVACDPVVAVLLEELQSANILHIDETPWYEAGHFCWLWVVLSSATVVFMIGNRKKETFLQLVSSAFVGWLVSARRAVHILNSGLWLRKFSTIGVRWLPLFNPELPVTNNDAERALRHAVIARRISHGTRSHEGSKAYAALLSVIKTCRLRNLKPWTFLAEVIWQRRKGLLAPSIPLSLQAA